MPLIIVRHGETAWSKDRRHTGRTDVPLTAEGRVQAASLAPLLRDLAPLRVLTSPLSRATETCALAGFGAVAETEERLLEWDYGAAEGRTTAEIRIEEPGWSVWTHPSDGAETLPAVAARVDDLLGGLRADADLSDPAEVVLLFAHAHLLRILGARWCGFPPEAGSNFVLDPASISVLGFEREQPCIERWNLTSHHRI